MAARLQAARGGHPPVTDMDHTLIDNRERTGHGFAHMLGLYREMNLHVPLYIVTARPKSDEYAVKKLLQKLGCSLPADRLIMMEDDDYHSGDSAAVTRFKWEAACEIARCHGGNLVQHILFLAAGDRNWDVGSPCMAEQVTKTREDASAC